MGFKKNCEIYYEGNRFGTLKWGKEGLKTIFRAESFLFFDGIYRVFAFSSKQPENQLLIGVLEPDHDILALTKGFSDYDFKIKNIHPDEIDSAEAVFGGPVGKKTDTGLDGWEPISIPETGIQDATLPETAGTRRILARAINNRLFVAEPIRRQEEILLAPAISIAETIQINKEWYAVFEVKNGLLKKAVNINFHSG